MKGVNFHRARGKLFTLTLLFVVCMTVLLWSYERKPLVSTLLSSQDRYTIPTSDVFLVASNTHEDLVKSEDHPVQESPAVDEETDGETESQNREHATNRSSVTKVAEQSSVIQEETEDKTKSQPTNVGNTKPLAEQSSVSNEDEQPHVHGETEDKKPQIAYVENTEPMVEQSSVQKEDKQSHVHQETEDKKPQIAYVENTAPLGEQSSVSKEDKQSLVHRETEDKKRQTTYVENTKPLAEQSYLSKEDEQSLTHGKAEDKKLQMAYFENTVTLDANSSGAKKDGKGGAVAFSSEKKVCNYAKGRWVVDPKRPLYSGFKCKQWLSEMWACKLTQRPDFGYETYRWQPENCDMPDFESSAFLKRMQDKTIAFVGDSLGRQQFQSLMCMVTGGEEDPDVQNVGRRYGLVTHHGAARPDGWAFWFPKTNTTILYYWSSCLCDLEPLNRSDPSSEVAMHLDRPPSFLKRFLHHFDVLILNTGHHWNRGKVRANRWVMYVDGKPNQDRRLAPIGNAKNFTIFSVAKWVDSELTFHPQLKAFFRTISPRHFFNGEWNTGGSCENTTPLARGNEVKQDESSDQVISGAVRGTKVNLLDITALSQLRDEGHISRYSIKASSRIQDCLHWCLPGIPDTWNEVLAAQL